MTLPLARQPIFDRDDRIAAYAILHPAPQVNDASADQLVVDTALGGGIDQLTDGHPAFLRVSPTLLRSDAIRMLDPRLLTLELQASAAGQPDVREACLGLAAAGYHLALDHFALTEATAGLLGAVRTVKVDVREHGPATLTQLASQLRPTGVRMLAGHAENRIVRDACVRLGFELFQGYRFTQPEILTRRELPLEHVQTFRLLKQIRDPAVHESAIEEGFRSDVTLSYRLLRMVNSAAMGGRGIWSIGHAIRLLGREALHRWVSLLLLSSVSDGGVGAELTYMSLLRARFCELLAGAAGVRPASGPLFLVGVFSLLDLMVQSPMPDLVARLDVDDEVGAALLGRDGFFGAVLLLVEAYEDGRWADAELLAGQLGITPGVLADHYMTAVAWARERTRELAEPSRAASAGR